MSSRIGVLLVVLVGSVSACAPDQARHTVDEYRANTELRHVEVKRCQSDPGTLAKTPDCINARQAAVFEDRVRLRDVPAVGLGQKPDSSDTDAGTASPESPR